MWRARRAVTGRPRQIGAHNIEGAREHDEEQKRGASKLVVSARIESFCRARRRNNGALNTRGHRRSYTGDDPALFRKRIWSTKALQAVSSGVLRRAWSMDWPGAKVPP